MARKGDLKIAADLLIEQRAAEAKPAADREARAAKRRHRQVEQERLAEAQRLAAERRGRISEDLAVTRHPSNTKGDVARLYLDTYKGAAEKLFTRRLATGDEVIEVAWARGAGTAVSITRYFGRAVGGGVEVLAWTADLGQAVQAWGDHAGEGLLVGTKEQADWGWRIGERYGAITFVRDVPALVQGRGEWVRQHGGRLRVGSRGETVVPAEQAHRLHLAEAYQEPVAGVLPKSQTRIDARHAAEATPARTRKAG